tara:strand:- start:3717 stop:4280 length:564 start_codon:yes stop_codon:yes gene_type:complete
MKIGNTNTEVWIDNQIMRNAEIVSCRDNDSDLDLTRDISFKLFKDDLEGGKVAHQFYVRARLIEEFTLKFFGHHNTTETSSNRMSAYTDGETVDIYGPDGELVDEQLIVKNLVTYLLSGGDLESIDIVDYGYADYMDVQQYFMKVNGEILFNDQIPNAMVEIAKEVLLSSIEFDGKTAKELGFNLFR